MVKKNLNLIIVIILVMTMTITGCSSSNSDVVQTTNSESEENTIFRDDLIFGLPSEPAGFDPQNSFDVFAYLIQSQVFEGLVKLDQDENIVPSLAERWEVSNDGLEYTFYIKEGVKFHNGETLTAQDVVFSLNRCLASPYCVQIYGMDYAEIIDDYTVKLYMKFPYSVALNALTTTFMYIVNEKAVTEDEEKFMRNPVGTGPYVVKEWISGDKIVLESFKDYHLGEAKIKKLTFKPIVEKSTAMIALEKGEIDVYAKMAVTERQTAIDNDNLVLYETDEMACYSIFLNCEEGPFSNKLVRNAVSYAIDKEAILIGALEGVGTVAECLITPGVFGYPENFKGNPYDPKKAKQLLAEAGYPDGFNTTIRVVEEDRFVKPAQIIQENLRAIGINADVEILERSTYISNVLTKSNFEITYSGMATLIKDADVQLYWQFHEDYYGSKGNFVKYINKEVNRLLEFARTSDSEQERKELYFEICKILREDAPQIPILIPRGNIVANKNLQGVKANNEGLYFVYDFSWK